MDSSRTLSTDVTLFAAAAAILTEGLVHLDERQQILTLSAAAQRMLAGSGTTAIGGKIGDVLHSSNTADPCVPPGSPRQMQLVLRSGGGDPLAVDACSVALTHAGVTEGWLIAFAAKPRLGEIEQLKNELVSTVSHELKTPLAAIKAYTATLRQNPTLYDTQRDAFLGVVEQQADQLSRLVDDMLLVTRVESGQLLRRRVIVPVEEVLNEAAGELVHDPNAHTIAVHSEGVSLSGDPERLRNIFRNLLENAVKYSPQGGVIDVSARQGGGHTVVEIRDHGIGIAEEHLPYIFDRFYRAESEVTSSVGGSGLGLFIVHALVRAHGGSIDVHSTVGEGTTFTLRFPLR